jgi:hypothetical protein
MYEFAEETSLETLEECYKLCADHFDEVGMEGTFNIDWGVLQTFLQAGILAITIARVEGEIVAYYMNILTNDFMTKLLTSKEMAIYVSPKYRGGRLFMKLCDWNEELLVSKGVVINYMTFMHGHNDKLPLRLGYEPLEITYKKVIGEK